MRAALLIAAFCASVATSHAEPVVSPADVSAEPEAERLFQVVEATNRARAKAGLGPLKLHAALATAAGAHARDMAEKRYFDHRSPSGEGPDERCRRAGYPDWTGENIFRGTTEARAAVEAWMASAGHRQNILNPDSREMGVGYAKSGSRDGYWVELFGAQPDTMPVVIEDEAWSTASTTVTLYLYGREKATRVRFSNDGSTFSEWEPFQTRRTWKLQPGEGPRTVTVELSDADGNIVRSADSILLRTPQKSAPEGSKAQK